METLAQKSTWQIKMVKSGKEQPSFAGMQYLNNRTKTHEK